MRKSVAIAAVLTAAALPCTVLAAHRVPGEWEITSQMHFTQGGVQIPPEVQAQMKARGIKLPDFTEPHTFKQCLTPEQAARDEHPDFSQDKSCTSRNASWSGSHFHADITCNGAHGPRHGVIDGTITAGGKAYSGTFRMEGDDPHMGGHYVMQGRSSGQWLGPSCGKDDP